ncbi:dihydroorotase [Tilletia horrida]|uniref:Dihydroorotase n=1 Tax=Tilletia horrida TaxID=155126 RepID=A0AAN6GEI5_9BASI|nr:dihydroorotase [Tilletia horrida]
MSTAPSEITVSSPFDAHVHLRQGDMCTLIAPHVAQGGMHTAYVMPNLVPPISTTDEAVAYHARLRALAPSTTFLMSLYLSPALTPDEVRKAKASGVVWGVKSYPRGVTTNSASGVESYDVYYPVFEAMEEAGLVLNLHGEVPSDAERGICVLNAEERFLEHLHKLHAAFPKLRIILEHATTRAAVEAVKACGPTVGCTITPHHLELIVDDWAGKPLNFCKPVAKYPDDRAALRAVIKEGHPRFFLGSDSAPHPLASKLPSAHTHGLETVTSCGCAAGVYTSAILLPLCAHLLDSFGALDQLEGYVSSRGRAFYGLDGGSDQGSVKLRRSAGGKETGSAKVPIAYVHPDHEPLAEGDKQRIQVVPFLAGKQLNWEIVS